ncbi:MAG: DUF4013 domain-containing protein [Eggerthellaceae bacterium]|nr:DUF4013 domain-containing protein [Eggerthellaceae bacterium]
MTLIKMTLLHLIPIFGQIVGYGYKYAWGREAAWRIYNPLPRSIFSNTDGSLYVRGGLTFLYIIVLSLALRLIQNILEVIAGASFILAAVSGIVSLLFLIITIAVYITAMHIALYNKFSAGFSFSRFARLYTRDSSGVWRLIGFYVLASIIEALILSCVIIVVGIIWFSIGGNEVLSDMEHFVRHLAFFGEYSALALLGEASMAFLIGLVVVVSIVFLVALFLTQVIELLLIRGIGYWYSQFDVASWGGPNDPLPFERTISHPPYQQNTQTGDVYGSNAVNDSFTSNEQGDVSSEAGSPLSDESKQ